MVRKTEEKKEPVFLTSTQAAEFLNVSLTTFKKLIVSGKIRTIRTPGGHYRIDKQELLSALYQFSGRIV